MNHFVISTPDLLRSPFIQGISANFEYVNNVKLEVSIDGYDDNIIQAGIDRFNQNYLLSKQKHWYQLLPDDQGLVLSDDESLLMSMKQQLSEKTWLLQGPLLTFSLPIWLQVFESSSVIFQYSKPLDCARYLQQKWRFPIAFGLALWESYVISACKNLINSDALLMSISSFQNNPDKVLKRVAKKMGLTSYNQELSFDMLSFNDSNEYSGFEKTFEYYQSIFKMLEKGHINKVAKLPISEVSGDIIEYYGQLRAGFEQVNEDNKLILQKLSTLDQHDGEIEPDSVDQLKNNADDNANEPLIKVRVHIDGMDTLEFCSEPDSPILVMLQNHLAKESVSADSPDELIYLNYDENQTDTLYFMSSTLRAIETEPLLTTDEA